MDTMQKQAKTEDTHQVLSSFEQGNSVISTLKSEDHQQNDSKLEKHAKTEDTQQVLSSFELGNSVISAQKSEDHQQNDCKVEKQAKTEDTQQVLSSFEQENSVISDQKSEDHQQNDSKLEKQAKTEDTQVLSSFEQENSVISDQKSEDTSSFEQENSVISDQKSEDTSSFEQENSVISDQKSEDHQQNDSKLEKQSETYTPLGVLQREVIEEDEKVEVTNLETLDDEPMSMNDEEINEENDDVLMAGPRERLKRHRKEVAGQVWIPDLWGHEDLLKNWIDCSSFDKCLMTHSIMSARASLIEEGRRANSTSLSVENSC